MSNIVRNWTCSLNQAPASNATLLAQAQSILRARKDNYKNAGWSVVGSSDSTTAGMDATDRWTADNKLVWAAGGVAHSWIVLKSPTNNPSTGKSVYVGLQCSTGAGNPHLVNEFVTSVAPTAGSTTVDPTTTGGSTKSMNNVQFLRSPVVNAHYHALYNTQGDVVFFTSSDGVGWPAHTSGYCTTLNFETGLNYPCIAWSNWNDATPGGWALLLGLNGGASTAGFMQDGSIATSTGVMYYTFGSLFTAQMNGNQGTIVTASKWLLMPAPVGIAGTPSGGASTVGFGGTLVDIWLAPSGANTPLGTEEPASPATSTTAKFGDGMFPNGGVTPVF